MREIAFVQRRLEDYHCQNAEEEFAALREMLQEMVLAGLARTDFFVKAAFHGGTLLRIFESTRRFSEDLDFALVKPDPSFDLLPYLRAVADELAAFGVILEARDKSNARSDVKKGFLKSDSLVRILELRFANQTGSPSTPPKITIKLEVDANPPPGASYTAGQLLFPFAASVRNFDRSSCFAGKMHALLCRQYVKGRDWFDFIWYCGVGATLNHALLSSALDQLGPWSGKGIATTGEWVRSRLLEIIPAIDWNAARRDVLPFVHASERASLAMWNASFFASLVPKVS